MIKTYPTLFSRDIKIRYSFKNDSNIIKFYRSTTAINFLIKSIKRKYNKKIVKLALPFLYCKSTTNFLVKENKNLKILHYDTKIDDQIYLDNLNRDLDFDILIVVHFFNKKSILQDCSLKEGKFIIEDCTHLNKEEFNSKKITDFRIFSPYKYYPLPFLGILEYNHKNSWITKDYKKYIKKELLSYRSVIHKFFEDIKFMIKNILPYLFNRRFNKIDFSQKEYEKINNFIFSPSLLSLILYNFYYKYSSNIYSLHNRNNAIISKYIKVLNPNWEVSQTKNNYMCRVKINYSYENLLFINRLIMIGMPFSKWPDLYFNDIDKSKYPKAHYEYINNIYLPINSSNNPLDIKKSIKRFILKYIESFYYINSSNIVEDNKSYRLKINIKTKYDVNFNVKVKFKKFHLTKILKIYDIKVLGNKDILYNENNIIIYYTMMFIKKRNNNFILNSENYILDNFTNE